ncbi:Cyclase/dehydrase [Penicillium maclennaniae]|uniref:Cyclase/dehydrase n=1 Tax=Penicillium maclennaniae TaxID=1343394 RepID=UPI002541FFDA|nr:Cyclase/dehydrase [Penicillium maclennaniae]KAJ5682037.1 Cyclase/dehydrase [Penicillium maclennaniae]
MRPACSLRQASRSSRTLLRSQGPTPLRTSRTITTAQCPRHAITPQCAPYIPRRAFSLPSLSSFIPSPKGNSDPKRVLTATRTLPFSPALLFKVISSVESYSQFLPFLTASTVTARDPNSGYPTQAFLTVGYGPLSETFTSRVDCDSAKGVVEARSGAKYAQKTEAAKSGLGGFFSWCKRGDLRVS